jgi:hypothetical protein
MQQKTIESVGDHGDIPASPEDRLYEEGFVACFIGSLPCPGFLGFQAGATDKEPKKLRCSRCPDPLSPREADLCQEWRFFLSGALAKADPQAIH